MLIHPTINHPSICPNTPLACLTMIHTSIHLNISHLYVHDLFVDGYIHSSIHLLMLYPSIYLPVHASIIIHPSLHKLMNPSGQTPAFLSVHLFICPSFILSTTNQPSVQSLPIYPPIHPSVHASFIIHPSIHPFFYKLALISVYQFFCPPSILSFIFPSTLPIHPSSSFLVYGCIHLSIHPSVSSIRPSIHTLVCLSVHPLSSHQQSSYQSI